MDGGFETKRLRDGLVSEITVTMAVNLRACFTVKLGRFDSARHGHAAKRRYVLDCLLGSISNSQDVIEEFQTV